MNADAIRKRLEEMPASPLRDVALVALDLRQSCGLEGAYFDLLEANKACRALDAALSRLEEK